MRLCRCKLKLKHIQIKNTNCKILQCVFIIKLKTDCQQSSHSILISLIRSIFHVFSFKIKPAPRPFSNNALEAFCPAPAAVVTQPKATSRASATLNCSFHQPSFMCYNTLAHWKTSLNLLIIAFSKDKRGVLRRKMLGWWCWQWWVVTFLSVGTTT